MKKTQCMLNNLWYFIFRVCIKYLPNIFLDLEDLFY